MLFAVLAASAQAQVVPMQVQYQGYLTTNTGAPVNGPRNISFRLYETQDAPVPVWAETHANVPVANGRFSVLLGSVQPLEALVWDTVRWLGMQVAGDEEMTPRQALGSAPFALRSQSAIQADAALSAQMAGTANTATSAVTVSGTVPGSQISGGIAGTQITGPVSGGVPVGYMILGPTPTAPPGYAAAGSLSGYYLFAREGGVSAAAPLAVMTSASTMNVAEGSSLNFIVTLSQAPAATVVVEVGSGDLSVATASPATLTFTPANFSVPQAVTVTAVQDQDTGNNNTTVTLTAAGATSAAVAVTSVDDDIQALIVEPSSLTVTEGGSTSFTVRLAFAPAGEVEVTVTSSNPEKVPSHTVGYLFNVGNYATPRIINVTALEDADVVNDTVFLTLDASVAVSPTPQITVNVTDNDTQNIDVSTTDLNVLEGGTATFTVRLTQDPGGEQLVTVTSGDPSKVAVSPSTMLFSSEDFLTPQTVTVSGVADADLLNHSVTVSLTSSGVTARTVNVNVTDTGP